MIFERSILEAAYTHSFFNQKEIMQSKFCGCFFCLRVIKPIEILEWMDRGTATCPYCGIDSVIGDKSGYLINDESFLRAMNELFF